MMFQLFFILLNARIIIAIIEKDEITNYPGLVGKMPARQWSGYLKVDGSKIPGGQTFYSHYMLIESQKSGGGLTKDPLVLWQQGGPGSSGLGFGYFAELGPFRLTSESLKENKTIIPRPFPNPDSWDHLANILIFEHPPGTGFSYCEGEGGKPVACEWNDQTQAVAFYETLLAFYDGYTEFKGRDLFIIGESYAGLLIPFLAQQIASHEPNNPFKLQALAIGNGCPGTSGATPESRGSCNGPYGSYDTQHIVELAYGHSGVSRILYDNIMKECGFPCDPDGWKGDCSHFSTSCHNLLQQFDKAVGPFNIYNFYDNCGSGNQEGNGTMETFLQYATRFNNSMDLPDNGGTIYPCGTGHAAHVYLNMPSVRPAFHMKDEAFYGRPWSSQAGEGMNYNHYTGSSFDLYPDLLMKNQYRVLIYNGDADACVPYNSNEDWIVTLSQKIGLREAEPWRPWTLDKVVAGYVTTYSVPKSPHNFTFLTIKEAGHMVPQYQPKRAIAFFQRWLQNERY